MTAIAFSPNNRASKARQGFTEDVLPSEQQIIDAVFTVLDERGDDYIYVSPTSGKTGASCYYFVPTDLGWGLDPAQDLTPGEGSCLFGAALIEHLNVPLVEMSLNVGGISSLLLDLSGYATGVMTKAYSPAFRSNMAEVQQAQDNGTPYGQVREILIRLGYRPTKNTKE